MRGEVEIWRGDTLVLQESNMLVDGAGVTLADIMTVSRSLSGIEDHATSSILDASNYTIQAISFGTGSKAFKTNAHYNSENKEYVALTQSKHVTNMYKYGIVSIARDNLPDGTKSYTPDSGIPTAPDPAMTVLENDTNVSASIGGYDISSVFPGNGQLTNFIPSAIMSGMVENTIFSSTASGWFVGSIMGCFPDGSSAPYTSPTVQNARVLRNEAVLDNPWATNQNFGYFNEVSSMDVSGFVNMVMSSVPDSTYEASSPASGLTLSAEPQGSPNYQGFPFVEYSVALASGDVGHANFYGGIHHLGLWTIDLNASLQNGNTPPYSFSVLNNPRKYRLFCRKGFAKNICSIEDDGANDGDKNYTPLTIKWRLHFR
jgi:hypothetical protein